MRSRSSAPTAKSHRCAIYTRKSSEEGLEQDFNSLNAQREACEAYIKSQKAAGWVALPTMYDDGGFSGGNMERPALHRLLADIEAGRVDTVVVYKVDRLTRSPADFAKIVDAFDSKNVSFVSVTQQFNTTTSMGRLTLNMLLSFAQFEREVTGERIRDKIAASKAKGMWMGGMTPLGYDAKDRKLVINPEEAETVRHIFRRYVALKSVRALKEDLDATGIVSKMRICANGTRRGGLQMARGALYLMLQNCIYRGQIILACTRRSSKRIYGTKCKMRWPTSVAHRKALISQVAAFAERWPRQSPSHRRAIASALIERVVVNPKEVVLTVRLDAIRHITAPDLDIRRLPQNLDGPTRTLSLPARLRRTGMETKLLIQGPTGPVRRNADRSLIRLLAQAHRCRRILDRASHDQTMTTLAAEAGTSATYFTRVARLSFLSPEITKMILQGRQPPELTGNVLVTQGPPPISWEDQKRRWASPKD